MHKCWREKKSLKLDLFLLGVVLCITVTGAVPPLVLGHSSQMPLHPMNILKSKVG